MANIKSAKKRIIQNSKRADINKLRKSRIRSGIKRVHSLSSEKKKDEVGKQFLVVESELAKAVSKGVFKKNTASRIVSRLSKKVKTAN
tara:strand:+ start:362 stop:625 length:264 start_codon:yes stop_codon:yes gene_type:complete